MNSEKTSIGKVCPHRGKLAPIDSSSLQHLWSEDKLQSEVWKYVNNNYVINNKCVAYHVPNGGARNSIEGAKLKAMGVVPGVSDIFILCKGKVLYIELKTATGTQSKEQLKFEHNVKTHGAMYYLMRDYRDTCKLIDSFIRLSQ